MPDQNSVVGRMYNRTRQPAPAPKPVETPAEKEKRAVKVLAGMKVHGSHVMQVEIDGKLVDMPTLAYAKLLEEQVRETRNMHRELQNQHNKLVRQMDRMTNEMRKVKDELANKVNLR